MRQKNWVHERDDLYFPSGSNHAGEIRGLALSGMHVGVTVDALDKQGNALAELELLAGGMTRVFVDSGAFGEVRFDAEAQKFVTVRPITDGEWDQRIAVYERLAPVLRSQLYLVAPDKVGDQVQTLVRLERYAERLQALVRTYRVHLIVPIQNGEATPIEFDRLVREILDCEYIRGIPSKKGATSAVQLAQFCNDLLWDNYDTGSDLEAMGVRFHLLGLGPQSRRYPEIRAAIPSWAGEVTCDSVRIMALVGRSNGRGGQPRELTRRRLEIVAQNPELGVADVKFRMVQGYFLAEGQELVQRSMEQGWRDEELVDVESNGQLCLAL